MERSGKYLEAAKLWSSLANDSGEKFAAIYWIDAANNYEKAGDFSAQRQAIDRAQEKLPRIDSSERYQIQASLAKFYVSSNPEEARKLSRELLNDGQRMDFDEWGFGLACLSTAVATESLKDTDLTTNLYRKGFDSAATDLDSRMKWLSDIYEQGLRFSEATANASLETLIRNRLEANRAAWSSGAGTPAGDVHYALRAARAYRARAKVYREHSESDLAKFAASQADALTSR
ncbi:hypothetical protein [Cupriavidus pauculus]|uniref:hypothetical protein n=1 Tax=Cupriavidus pauculus TaxID=82633 RepID=UPI0038571A96